MEEVEGGGWEVSNSQSKGGPKPPDGRGLGKKIGSRGVKGDEFIG